MLQWQLLLLLLEAGLQEVLHIGWSIEIIIDTLFSESVTFFPLWNSEHLTIYWGHAQ